MHSFYVLAVDVRRRGFWEHPRSRRGIHRLGGSPARVREAYGMDPLDYRGCVPRVKFRTHYLIPTYE